MAVDTSATLAMQLLLVLDSFVLVQRRLRVSHGDHEAFSANVALVMEKYNHIAPPFNPGIGLSYA
jgi:hypothetical protein